MGILFVFFLMFAVREWRYYHSKTRLYSVHNIEIWFERRLISKTALYLEHL